ncbi:hypothetical protein D3C85_1276940 [compost metagenome]
MLHSPNPAQEKDWQWFHKQPLHSPSSRFRFLSTALLQAQESVLLHQVRYSVKSSLPYLRFPGTGSSSYHKISSSDHGHYSHNSHSSYDLLPSPFQASLPVERIFQVYQYLRFYFPGPPRNGCSRWYPAAI